MTIQASVVNAGVVYGSGSGVLHCFGEAGGELTVRMDMRTIGRRMRREKIWLRSATVAGDKCTVYHSACKLLNWIMLSCGSQTRS